MSKILPIEKKCYLCKSKRGPGGEMVDTLVSGASASRHVGSSPILGTKKRGTFLSFFVPTAPILIFPPNSLFYGAIFTASTPLTVATFGEGYSSLLMGKVVDMFYFPLFQWNNVPSWLSFLVDYNNYFFGAIFNLADAYISCAVVYLLIFHYRFFQEE